jgi:hypothetical protein
MPDCWQLLLALNSAERVPWVGSRHIGSSAHTHLLLLLLSLLLFNCNIMKVTLQPSPAVQVLGSAKSNAQGLALLSEVKLRARPGTYTLAVASTTDRDVPPALVSMQKVAGAMACTSRTASLLA